MCLVLVSCDICVLQDILLDGQSTTLKTLPEDSVGVAIATLSAEDIDSDQTYTFTLEDGGMDVFEIQDTKLQVTLIACFTNHYTTIFP